MKLLYIFVVVCLVACSSGLNNIQLLKRAKRQSSVLSAHTHDASHAELEVQAEAKAEGIFWSACHDLDASKKKKYDPQHLCEACVDSKQGKHLTGKKGKFDNMLHKCIWNVKEKKCYRKKDDRKAPKYILDSSECVKKVKQEVDDSKVEDGQEPPPKCLMDLKLSIDFDSQVNFNLAKKGAVFVTFVLVPQEETPDTKKDPKAAQLFKERGYKTGQVFLCPGTARKEDAGKYVDAPLTPGKTKMGGQTLKELCPIKQPHSIMLGELSSYGGQDWWIGGALFKATKGAKQNEYRWTSGQVNGFHGNYMAVNRQNKATLPKSLQKKWNPQLDKLLFGS